MDNSYDWETLEAIKADWHTIRKIVRCLVRGHDYIPDECGYCCQVCYWSLSTDLDLETWKEYYDARPSKWTWNG